MLRVRSLLYADSIAIAIGGVYQFQDWAAGSNTISLTLAGTLAPLDLENAFLSPPS